MISSCLHVASLDDLRVDMCAYGMVLFNLINPGLKHPFQINMQTNQFASKTPLQLLEKFAKSKEKPIHHYTSENMRRNKQVNGGVWRRYTNLVQ